MFRTQNLDSELQIHVAKNNETAEMGHDCHSRTVRDGDDFDDRS